MKYYKIINEKETHNGMKYKKGLNTDILPFNPHGSCEKGGIYFSSKDILAFLDYGQYIREVILPEREQVYENPGTPKKYKAHRVILGRKRKITKKVIKELLDEGANIHALSDHVLRWASYNGQTETVKILLDRGADIHADNDYALRYASHNGQTETVKLLLDRGANIHADNDFALRWASQYGHTETVKFLLDRGADIHANNDSALCWASENGHTETVKLLLDRGADIHANNDSALRYASSNGHTETVKLLKEYMENSNG